MESLIKLQESELAAGSRERMAEAEVKKLRAKVPASILGHFDRLVAKGKKAVALARNGVCSECHLRISSGTLAGLASREDIHLCENCGRYLYMAEQELVKVRTYGVAEPKAEAALRVKRPPARRRKKVSAGRAPEVKTESAQAARTE